MPKACAGRFRAPLESMEHNQGQREPDVHSDADCAFQMHEPDGDAHTVEIWRRHDGFHPT